MTVSCVSPRRESNAPLRINRNGITYKMTIDNSVSLLLLWLPEQRCSYHRGKNAFCVNKTNIIQYEPTGEREAQ